MEGAFVFKDGTRYEGAYLSLENQPEPQANANDPKSKNAAPAEPTEPAFRLVRHGYGKNSCGKTGRIYEGEFEHDQMHGTGKLTCPDGVCYEGSFDHDKFHGTGTYSFSDGSVFSGTWENGFPHGFGTAVIKSQTWTGHFHNGVAKNLSVEY
ncbi:MAG: hypothetical protein SGCHY_002531 [Lobulomycetales sp.]